MLQSFIGKLPSGESIDFQFNSKLASKLVEETERLIPIISELDIMPDRGTVEKILRTSKLSAIINNYTGINVVFGYHEAMGASVYPPNLGKNVSITSGMFERYKKANDFDLLTKDANVKEISVNLKTGYVTGVDKIKTPLLISNYFFAKHTARGVVSVILHEIGHLVSLYYSLVVTAGTNFLLKEFSERLFETKSDKARAVLVANLNDDILKVSKQKELVNAESKEDIRIILAEEIAKKNRATFGEEYYNMRAWEAMADNFVVKHGLFHDLVIVLKDNSITRGRTVIQFLIIIAEIGLGLGVVTFLVSTFDNGDEYDKPIKRLEVIRKQAIAGLKVAGDDEGRKLLENIQKATEVIGDDKDFLSVGERLARMLAPGYRQRMSNVRTQQALEHFSISEFNVTLEKLKNL